MCIGLRTSLPNLKHVLNGSTLKHSTFLGLDLTHTQTPQLVGQEDDAEQNEGSLINETLPGLIKAGKNPTPRMLGSDGKELA